ncbi:MAG: glycosyltransferase family 4 protein [Bacteroidia bacterium]
MTKRNHVLVVYANKSSFVSQDIDALSEKNEVTEYHFGSKKGFSQFIAQLKFLWFLTKNIYSYNLVFCWFADYHCLLPSILKSLITKKYIVAIGGFDAVSIPQLNYGGHRSKIRSAIIKYTCNRADLLICSSKYIGDTLIETIGKSELKSKIKVAYPGINCFENNSSNITCYKAIYVAAGSTIDRMKIKGVDRFLEIVKASENDQFILIGPDKDALRWVKNQALNNLELISSIERSALAEYYQKSQFICLFSRFEAFGMVLLEGICEGCIPITLENIGTKEILQFKNAPGLTISDFDLQKVLHFLRSKNPEKEDRSLQVKRNREYLAKYFGVDERAKYLSNFIAN